MLLVLPSRAPWASNRPSDYYAPLRLMTESLAHKAKRYIGLTKVYEQSSWRPPREILLGPPKDGASEKKVGEASKLVQGATAAMETALPGNKGPGASKGQSAAGRVTLQTNPIANPKILPSDDDEEEGGGIPVRGGQAPTKYETRRSYSPASLLKLPNFRPGNTWFPANEGGYRTAAIAATATLDEGGKEKTSPSASEKSSFATIVQSVVASLFAPSPGPSLPSPIWVASGHRDPKKPEP